MVRPPYFERIRARASARWDQLEHDPELAGPWHQLFKQVQSPRHVVSELLQNADDSGATRAVVAIEGDEFVFSHNGEDFTEEHFASLCRFGYSNKRALHTIGFRGVGFKSTFSVGDDEVRLFTPTLSVAFKRKRFTEPIWIDTNGSQSKLTQVRVKIKDASRKRELQKNLEEWFKSPASLLFFRNIRSLTIDDREVEWRSQGRGPFEGSEWMALSGQMKYLVIRSNEEEFPQDAVEEIRQERMLSIEEDAPLPPCRVELVLGLEGRLFVILPTGVKTELPFACNAPFVQDPARVKIKDPETSPTNQWLLRRVGQLAAAAMTGWLKRTDAPAEERAKAYRLFPNVNREDNSLEGVCAATAEEEFDRSIQDEEFLLTEPNQLVGWGKSAALPSTILDIWSTDQAQSFFVEQEKSILSRHISDDDRKKLIEWGCVTEIEKGEVLKTIASNHLPKPARRKQLLLLWQYVAEAITGYYYYPKPTGVRIFPVRGKEVLYAASEVVRVSEEKLLQSDDDWDFLSKYLLALDHNWPRYLTKQRREAEEANDRELAAQVNAAYQVLTALGHKDASDVSVMMQRVSNQFFSSDEHETKDYVRLAHIAANLGATVSDDFQFVTRDEYLTAVNGEVVADLEHDLDTYVDPDWYSGHALSDVYSSKFVSCTSGQWESWIVSGKSKLLTFVPLSQKQERIWNREKLNQLLSERGAKQPPHCPYVTDTFVIDDWDFDASVWQLWETLAKEDEAFWRRLLERILRQPRDYWSKSLGMKISQVATTGTKQQITKEVLLPSWIMKFRALPCLQDTWGYTHQPAELLRRTPETESLLDVEPFIKAELDTEANRPLFISLGVRDTPTGPDRLLERLTALSQIKDPPVIEVEKWYKRLDQMITKCSTDELERIKNVFQIKKIILTEDKEWVRAGEVFINADEEDVPDAAVVLSSVRHLSLWHKVNVADRPTADLAIQWLKSLPSGQRLSQDEARRVRSLLPKYPERIWQECEHWLNLEGEWTLISDLRYALTMQSLVPWSHLFKETKQRIADFQKLPTEICQLYPFVELPTLASCIEERFQEHLFQLPEPQHKPWLNVLGTTLRRIVLDSDVETDRVRTLARNLAQTVWQTATGLEAVPYIDGVPAGAARRIDVLWKDAVLYVEDRSPAKVARAIAQELGRIFGRVEIIDAIKLCYERSAEFISEYLEENFKLLPAGALDSAEEKDAQEKSASAAAGADSGDAPQPEPRVEPPVKAFEEPSVETSEVSDEPEIDLEEPAEGETTTPRRKHVKPSKPSLIERFAAAKGFQKDGDERFFRTDGSSIAKANEMRFPWEQRSASGELVQCYWLKDHCLQKEPLDLAAEIWNLCDKSPRKYSLILADEHGGPVEISGNKLQEMRDRGEITFHAATFRLVYESK